MKKLLFIYNPYSGKGVMRRRVHDVVMLFRENGYKVNVHHTRRQGDATRRISRTADQYDLIVVSGGDGTLNEAIRGLIDSGKQVPLGYIPSGSTNDFGSSIGLKNDPMEAARHIMAGKTFSCDVGMFDGHPFIYIAAFGKFTAISYQTSQNLKHYLGHLAYLLEVGKQLFYRPAIPMKITLDDNEVIEGKFIYGMITNSTSIGGFRHIIGDGVALDDGRFEVTLVKAPGNTFSFHAILFSLVLGRKRYPLIKCRKARKISIETSERVDWTLDGEFGGTHSSLDIEVLQKHMVFCCGSETDF